MTWPEAAVVIVAIGGFVCFFGLIITERWPWEKRDD